MVLGFGFGLGLGHATGQPKSNRAQNYVACINFPGQEATVSFSASYRNRENPKTLHVSGKDDYMGVNECVSKSVSKKGVKTPLDADIRSKTYGRNQVRRIGCTLNGK